MIVVRGDQALVLDKKSDARDVFLVVREVERLAGYLGARVSG